MQFNVNNHFHKHKFWFFVRKGIFQVVVPLVLAWMSLCGFITGSHIYFYTSVLLFLYTTAKYLLEYLFSICAEDIVLKKEINLDHTTNLLLDGGAPDEFHLITIKKIFKLRYSILPVFSQIVKLCWILGIDCPVLIPVDIVNTLAKSTNISQPEDDAANIYLALSKIYSYQPKLYKITPVDNDPTEDEDDVASREIITRKSQLICDIKKELFNLETNYPTDNF